MAATNTLLHKLLVVTTLFLLAKALATGDVYHGTGTIFFTNLDEPMQTGIRIVYRPEKLTWWNGQLETRLAFFSTSSMPNTKSYYRHTIFEEADWEPMSWVPEGQYFTYEQGSGKLRSSTNFGYGIIIYNGSQAVYNDTYSFYKAPLPITDCQLDDNAFGDVLKCSEALLLSRRKTPQIPTEPYRGKGSVLFSHHSQSFESGTRVVYKPEKLKKYSGLGQGWAAYLTFYSNSPLESLKRNYYERIIKDGVWMLMRWNEQGQYYSYEQTGGELTGDSWIAYGAVIYNSNGQVIYNDTYSYFNTPAMIPYCELDGHFGSRHSLCSAAWESLKLKKDPKPKVEL